MALLTCLAARPAYADAGDAINGAVYIAGLAVTGMSVIALSFIKGGRKEKLFGFIFCLLASALALPLIVIVTFTAGIYIGFALAFLVLLLMVDFLNKSTARRAAEVEEELRRDAGNNDVPYVPEPGLQKEARVEALKSPAARKPVTLQDKALAKAQANWIVGVALIYPIVAGFIVRNNAPEGVTIQHYFLVFLPPIISFWWLPIKTYGARFMYMVPLAAAYAAAVSVFLILAYGYDDCPVRRVAMGSECVPKQWEASAQRYFREHPDTPYAVPSGGR